MGAFVILRSFGKTLGQMSDPRFLRVVLVGVALTLALLVGIYALFLMLIETFAPQSVEIPFIGPIGGLDTLLSWGSALFMIGLSVFLMVPVASAFSGLFIEDVAQAVEDRHYPGLPAVPRARLIDALVDTANFMGLLVAVNTLALVVYAFAGPFIPLIFWALNGFLLGREYITLVAMRRLGRQGARDLRRRHPFRVWAAGTLMAAPLSIPLVNLFIPVLGVATFTHMFHAMEGRQAADPRQFP